jgi:hypothetical protein
MQNIIYLNENKALARMTSGAFYMSMCGAVLFEQFSIRSFVFLSMEKNC